MKLYYNYDSKPVGKAEKADLTFVIGAGVAFLFVHIGRLITSAWLANQSSTLGEVYNTFGE